MKSMLLNKHYGLVMILAALMITACGPDRPTDVQPTLVVEPTPTAGVTEELPEDVAAALDGFLESQVYSEGADPNTHTPGLVLLVDTPDGRYLKAAGVESLEDGTLMKPDSRLEIGSNSKSFTDVLLLQLQEERVLSLDDPLSKWLPEWADKIPNGNQMTLRQLAQHTAGIWDYADKIIGDATTDPVKLEQGYTPEELVQYAIDNGTPDFAPGEEGKWKYSNTGYILLGMVLEKATGQSLSELYRERIFEPLGLKTAALIEGVPTEGEITDGYWWVEEGKFNNTTAWNVSQGWAAGGIAMTAEELLTYAKALAAGKLFKNPDTLAEMLTFNPNAMDGMLGYGLGLLDFSKVGAPGSWGHEGQTAGFQSLWYTNPETGVTVVGLTNSASYSAYSFLTVAGILAGTSQSAPVMQETAALPRLEPLDECFVAPAEGVEVPAEYDCGYVVVPEFYQSESTRELKVPFIRFTSGKGTTVPPVLIHPGGPGASQLNEFVFPLVVKMFSGVITDRDVIFMDPRGTVLTETFLDCPAIYSLSWKAYEQGLDDESTKALFTETFRQCLDGFKTQGINFDAYNSLELAADVNSVREALGYEKIIYYGTSYGSQLGQHLMRDYPEILEAVILDGANSLSRKSWIEDRALDDQFGIDNLTKMCEADEKCVEAYPDIPALLESALRLFDGGPLPYTYTDPNNPSLSITGEVTKNDLADLIYGYQGDKNNVFILPAVLSSLIQSGNTDEITAMLGERRAKNIIASRELSKSGEAFLMHLAVVCSDDPVKSLDDIILEGTGDYARLHAQNASELYVQGCQLMGVRELPDSTDQNVTVNIPTLVLSGDLDVATPAFRSQLVVDKLPNATHVVFPGHTHVQLGQFNQCAADVFTQFIADQAAALDTSCLEETNVVGFLLPDGTFSLAP